MNTTTYGGSPAASTATLPIRRGTVAEAGRWATHYALVLIFLWFGLLKFTDYEASAIAPLVMNSPLVMWLHGMLGIGGTSHFLGIYELATALLLAARPWKPRLAVVGGVMAMVCFLITISFMLSTPGVVQPGFTNPLALSPMPGQFLLKDVVLLCASLWVVGASLDQEP